MILEENMDNMRREVVSMLDIAEQNIADARKVIEMPEELPDSAGNIMRALGGAAACVEYARSLERARAIIKSRHVPIDDEEALTAHTQEA